MSTDKEQVHRSGAYKQANKPHKTGRHRSKGSISVATKGKVSVKSISKKRKRELNKEQRRHQALQVRRNKRDETLSKKRCLGGFGAAPFLVCILPLNKLIDANGILSFLTKCDDEAVVTKSPSGITHISIPRFKQKFSFILPDLDNELAVLDTLKVCDTVLFVVSAAAGYEFGDQLIDDWGNNILACSFAQSLPTPTVVVTELESIPTKRQNEQKQEIQKLISNWLPEEKIMNLSKTIDAINVLRRIGGQKRKTVTYRDRRPYLYAESTEFIPNDNGTLGTLKVTGYLRGASLSVNDLIHIPNLGDFQMSQIDAPNDPFTMEKKRADKNAMDSEVDVIRILERADPTKQESLESENIPDPMEGEQTWPTEEELKMAEDEQKMRKVKKVPKGWSDYQAAWIPDVEEEPVSDLSDDEDSDESNYVDAMMSEEHSEYSDAGEEFDTMTESEIPTNDQQYDRQMDLLTEREELDKMKAAKTDSMFPDEIDTPLDTTARERFQKYRGLESFRTSPWDVKENLPSDYARIFQFENFDRTKKRILKERSDKSGVLPNWYITIHVKDVSQMLWNSFKETGAPVILFGLFSHEHKMTVVNTVLKRTKNYGAPIKSKERLIFQCGYRRFIVNPIFSQHTNGAKHKYERFFQSDSTAVATFYAPIQFPPAPVLCFKEVNGKLILVAHGNLLSCNPDRLVIKRVVLSGHPFKVHKRSAVIRFMFFNREDIVYFKPIKLRTKYGRTGHIKEPLGTHGHMKCIFDGQLKSMDTPLMNLYKRVFPKWNYEECIVSCDNSSKMES